MSLADRDNFVWTNHALTRMKERGISKGDVWAVWNNPDSSKYDRDKGIWSYSRNWGNTQIQIVTKRDKNGKWVIISVWGRRVRPQVDLLKRLTKFIIRFQL